MPLQRSIIDGMPFTCRTPTLCVLKLLLVHLQLQPAERKPIRQPPGWDSKIWGPAYGDFNRGIVPPLGPAPRQVLQPGNGRLMRLDNPQAPAPPDRPCHHNLLHKATEISVLEEVRNVTPLSKVVPHVALPLCEARVPATGLSPAQLTAPQHSRAYQHRKGKV